MLLIGLPLLLVGFVIYRYSDSAADMHRVVQAVPAAEKPIPPLAVNVFERLNTPGQRNIHVFRMIQEGLYENGVVPQRNQLNWHLRSAVSALLTPYRLSMEEQATLVWGRIYFGGEAHGLRAGAKKYFNKTPQDLTEEEMVRLWVIALNPDGYDKDSAKFADRIAWANRVWRGEQAAGTRKD